MKQRLLKNYMVCSLASLCMTGYAANDKEWPEIPLLNISTVDGVMPSATIIEAPEGCAGTAIKSEHIPGRLVITLKGETIYDSGEYEKSKSGIRIKIRGNTTGAYLPQKPYKLKLSKKADLIGFDADFKSKDWALLSICTGNQVMKNQECNLLTLGGFTVCRALGFPWTPRTEFVNVVLNGQYRGLYYLAETVEQAEKRIDVGADGFLIENDAYWWKEGEQYFKTEHLPYMMGYTFKYPDPDDLTEDTKNAIHEYMNSVESAIFSHSGANRYIDYESFAKWLLAHDILGSDDVAGSNMFLYKESLGNDEPNASKLKMGTLWDFDSTFRIGDAPWSGQHVSDKFYYPELLKDEKFLQVYKTLYENYKNTVYSYVEESFNKLKNDVGDALGKSMTLHKEVYSDQCQNTLDEQIDDYLTHLKARLESLESLMKEYDYVSGVRNEEQDRKQMVRRVDVNGTDFSGYDYTALPQNIYVETFSDGSVRKVIR